LDAEKIDARQMALFANGTDDWPGANGTDYWSGDNLTDFANNATAANETAEVRI
jgi:hypothetical protein